MDNHDADKNALSYHEDYYRYSGENAAVVGIRFPTASNPNTQNKDEKVMFLLHHDMKLNRNWKL